MMLQGHVIDTLLDPIYRDIHLAPYAIWSYFRGITAPTFFTISGLIFTYLLLKAKEKNEENYRMRKGIIRGFFLICVGYFLRIPFLSWFKGYFGTYFLVIDVLQCIGLSLILIVFLYFISFKKSTVFSVISLILCFVIFVTEPYYRNLHLENVPLIIYNYISKENGSIFTIIPWFGYVSFGAFLATLFNRYLHKKHFKPIAISMFLIVGGILILFSSLLLKYAYYITGIETFINAANYNYLFTRLGNVFIYFAIFYGFESVLKFPLVLKIGQKTLSIYVIHFIVIYGSITGIGLNTLIGKTLTPWEGVFVAILFLICVCFISFYYTKPNAFLYYHIRRLFKKIKKVND